MMRKRTRLARASGVQFSARLPGVKIHHFGLSLPRYTLSPASICWASGAGPCPRRLNPMLRPDQLCRCYRGWSPPSVPSIHHTNTYLPHYLPSKQATNQPTNPQQTCPPSHPPTNTTSGTPLLQPPRAPPVDDTHTPLPPIPRTTTSAGASSNPPILRVRSTGRKTPNI